VTAHTHPERVDGCYRCDLSADEVDRAALRHALEAVYAGEQSVETDAVLDQLDTLGYRVVER
jgi:hypothetical protein